MPYDVTVKVAREESPSLDQLEELYNRVDIRGGVRGITLREPPPVNFTTMLTSGYITRCHPRCPIVALQCRTTRGGGGVSAVSGLGSLIRRLRLDDKAGATGLRGQRGATYTKQFKVVVLKVKVHQKQAMHKI